MIPLMFSSQAKIGNFKKEEALESQAGSELTAHRIESDAGADSSVWIRTSIEVFRQAPCRWNSCTE